MWGRQQNKLTHHFRASAEAGFVDLRWRATMVGGVRFRLLRSERGYPETPETAADRHLLWEGADSDYQDRGVAGHTTSTFSTPAVRPETGRSRVTPA